MVEPGRGDRLMLFLKRFFEVWMLAGAFQQAAQGLEKALTIEPGASRQLFMAFFWS